MKLDFWIRFTALGSKSRKTNPKVLYKWYLRPLSYAFFSARAKSARNVCERARGSNYTHCFCVKRLRPPLRAAAPAHATAGANVMNFFVSIGRRKKRMPLQSVVDCVGPRWRLAPTTPFSSSSAVCPASERCACAWITCVQSPWRWQRLRRVVRYCGRLHCVARP